MNMPVCERRLRGKPNCDHAPRERRFAAAVAADKEAVGIRRELAAQNPAAYRPDLARTLTNLASLCTGTMPSR
jgi:hypothetical protein